MKGIRYRMVQVSFSLCHVMLSVSLGFAQVVPNDIRNVRLQQHGVEKIKLVVSVTDKHGDPVKDLPQSAFDITDGNSSQEIVEFNDRDVPVSVAIIFDLTGSMGNRQGQISKQSRSIIEALVRFVQLSNSSNQYFVIAFNKTPHLLLDGAQDSDSTIGALYKINNLPFGGGSAFLDAFALGVAKVSEAAHQKRAVILITDGSDNSSQTPFKKTVRLLQQTDTVVYPIFLLPEYYSDVYNGSSLDDAMQSMLKEYATLSGGIYFQSKRTSEIEAFIERVAAGLRQQYVIGIRPSKAARDGCHHLKVRLTSADDPDKFKSFSIRARKSYCP